MNRRSAPRVTVIDTTKFRVITVEIQYASTGVSSLQPACANIALKPACVLRMTAHTSQNESLPSQLCSCFLRGECGNSWNFTVRWRLMVGKLCINMHCADTGSSTLSRDLELGIAFLHVCPTSCMGSSHTLAQTVIVEWPLSAAFVM